MTTNDPFANPPGDPAAQPAPAQPTQPAPPPGMLTPQATPPGLLTPPAAPYGGPGASPYPFAPPVLRPPAPTGLATGAIILTGVYALVSLYGALTVASQVETLKETYADPENASFDVTSTLIGMLTFVVAIASYVVLALWMTKIRSNRTAVGTTPGGPPAVEWWGWFVPIANFVLPLLGMRAITKRLVGFGLLLGWWIPFCAVWVIQAAASSAQFRAIDFSTGELADPDVLDSMVPLTWAATVAIVISWAFLTVIIRKTTAKHLDN